MRILTTAPRAKRDDGGNSMGIGRGGQTNIKEDEAVEVVGIAANVRGSVFEKRPRGLDHPVAERVQQMHVAGARAMHEIIAGR